MFTQAAQRASFCIKQAARYFQHLGVGGAGIELFYDTLTNVWMLAILSQKGLPKATSSERSNNCVAPTTQSSQHDYPTGVVMDEYKAL